METPESQPEPQLDPIDTCTVTRWVPSALLDLSPAEPLVALRTPHRVMVQALPATREALAALLGRTPFEIVVDLETDAAPLRHAPFRDVHEARITADIPLDWPLYYAIVDGLQDDLLDSVNDPVDGLLRGRLRLLAAEDAVRRARRKRKDEVAALEAAWAQPLPEVKPEVEKHGEPAHALQQYARGLTAHLLEHAASREFVDWARALLDVAERRPDAGLPALGARESKLLSLWAQHRLFGAPWLTDTAGMTAGWQLLLSAHLLAVWFAGLAQANQRGTKLHDALVTSLWMLDQGLWRDEPLLHDVLRNLNASEYTSPALAIALCTALGAVHARA